MSFSITVDVLCPKIVAKFYVHPLDFSHGILRACLCPFGYARMGKRGLGGEGGSMGRALPVPSIPQPLPPQDRKFTDRPQERLLSVQAL